jgi:hypothetical protein
MNNYIGNCSDLIDWSNVLAHLEDQELPIVKRAAPEYWLEPTVLEPDYIGSTVEKTIDQQMCDDWVKAGYFFDSAVWLVYRAGVHYSQQVENLICEYLNIRINWSVISRIDPGYTVPLHIDPDDDPSRDGDKKVRFIWQISPSARGQLLTVGDQAFTNLKVGDIYQFDHYLNQHAAANVGLHPAYYFSIEGFKRG